MRPSRTTATASPGASVLLNEAKSESMRAAIAPGSGWAGRGAATEKSIATATSRARRRDMWDGTPRRDSNFNRGGLTTRREYGAIADLASAG